MHMGYPKKKNESIQMGLRKYVRVTTYVHIYDKYYICLISSLKYIILYELYVFLLIKVTATVIFHAYRKF